MNGRKKRREEAKRSAFWTFMGGDFLLHEKVVRFYPYVLLLFLLAALTIANDIWIDRKEKRLNELDQEYKNTVSQIKKQNEFLPYDSLEKLRELLREEGFEKEPGRLYKIPVPTERGRR